MSLRGSAQGEDRRARLGRLWLSAPAVSLLCLLVTGALSAVIVHQRGLSGDEFYYVRMAAHPGGPHNFPYAFRVGLPFLVHALPFSQSFSWQLLALLAGAAAGGAMFALLVQFTVPEWLATGLAVGFCASPPLLVVLLRNGRGVDALAILIITLGCLFIVRRQRVALALTLLAGATVHESCLFLVPFTYAMWAERPLDLIALRDTALTVVLPVALYVLLRATIVAVGENYQPGYGGDVLGQRLDVVRHALSGGGWKVELRRLALSFGPLWLAAPPALRDLPFARRGLVLVGLCLLSMTFALDWGRAIFFAAPVFYVAAAWTVRDRRALALALLATLAMLDLGYGAYMQLHGVRHGLDTTAPPARGPVY